MKIIGMCGEPASGKSTIMRKFISGLQGTGIVKKEGLVAYTEFAEDRVIVAGIYDEAVFSGTDRTAKSCGPKFRDWLAAKNSDSDYDDWTFYWEGERFSNSKFFDFFRDECSDVTIYYLNADEETLNERNANRSNQNSSWRKGMATRMRNLREGYPVKIVEQGFTLK
jgi:GTPase SAR1 family protein